MSECQALIRLTIEKRAVIEISGSQEFVEAQVASLNLRKLAEQMQNAIKEEAEIIEMIMEAKGTVMETTAKMLQRMQEVQQKLLSAGAVR